MAALAGRGIPDHEARPIGDCAYSYRNRCMVGAPHAEAVVCVKVHQELHVRLSHMRYFDFDEGSTCHICASCYRLYFGTE